MNNPPKVLRVHAIGIGGIGVSALCRLLALEGARVSGSDLQASVVTNWFTQNGYTVAFPHAPEMITPDIDYVLVSQAIPKDDPELVKAKELSIPVRTYPEVLGERFNAMQGIGISGTNGKTSTTALVSLILINAGIDPTVIVGGRVRELDGNARLGKSEWMVIEADEYGRAFHEYHPRIGVITNIEEDHLDVYKNVEEIQEAFRIFAASVPHHGLVIGNCDDARVRAVLDQHDTPTLTFGFGDDAQVRASQLVYSSGETRFRLSYKGNDLGEIVLHVPGDFNIMNALAAAAVSLHLNVNSGVIKRTLESFRGTWRRFEVLGAYHEATIVSDYAHHPTAVRKTIHAARAFYPKKRIVAVFQPHHHHRTRVLHDEFVEALAHADLVIVPEIFRVPGRTKTEKISSRTIVRALTAKGISAHYVDDLSHLQHMLDRFLEPNDIVLMMGAGDIYEEAERIVQS
ncbi:MAG: UDP-N-acetylmuramate--L-alanine ligase [Candidatus Kerfeldbacteria bacterium]|nr:UDP-N-acetylmuramate--L-alanine ligase [Candidatus Kerfeldbacteria bacterium]